MRATGPLVLKINKKVPYTQLPDVFAKVDLLLLSNDFDNNSITYLKYSMPTKASEYMISGTPTLVYSSIHLHITLGIYDNGEK